MIRRKVKKYSLARLLSRQPKSLARDPHFKEMMSHYRNSEKLKVVRFSRKCYTLLNRATVLPENLKTFYRIYGLPVDPFFPLYFKIKRTYLLDREKKKKERSEYIARQMQRLPAQVVIWLKFLGEWERGVHHKKGYPLWMKNLFPSSKKEADSMHRYTQKQWKDIFMLHISKLEERYKRKVSSGAGYLSALYLFRFGPGDRPAPSEVKKRYRQLSKECHPDAGGAAEAFRELQWAREQLLGD